MKTKLFFLCMRPPVNETDDGDFITPPTPVGSSCTAVSGMILSRHNRDLQQKKRVAPEKYIRQLSINSNGNISERKSENPVQKDSQKAQKITRSVSEGRFLIKFSDQKPVSLKKPTNISNHKVTGRPESKSGPYLMVSCLFFTIFLGKLFGILCTLILVCSLYPHRKNNGNGSRNLKNQLVVYSPEKGSLQECNKRIIINGLLERKGHYRENNILFS